MKKQKTVKIYTAEWCYWCNKTKEFFEVNNIDYEEKDVERVPGAAEEMVMKSGQTGIPVIDVEGTIIIGFDKEALRKALGL